MFLYWEVTWWVLSVFLCFLCFSIQQRMQIGQWAILFAFHRWINLLHPILDIECQNPLINFWCFLSYPIQPWYPYLPGYASWPDSTPEHKEGSDRDDLTCWSQRCWPWYLAVLSGWIQEWSVVMDRRIHWLTMWILTRNPFWGNFKTMSNDGGS